MNTPSLRALRVAAPTPLQGATLAARRSRFRGVSGVGFASLAFAMLGVVGLSGCSTLAQTPEVEMPRTNVAALAPQGRLALVGNVDPHNVALRPGLVILKELTVVGSAHGTRQDLQAVLELVAAGLVRPVIAEELPLEQAAAAHGPARALGRRVLLPD